MNNPAIQVEKYYYKSFSTVSGFSNSAAKTVDGLTGDKENVKSKKVMEVLIDIPDSEKGKLQILLVRVISF